MDMEKKNKIENARIESVGLYYEGHFDNLYVRCVIGGRGWGANINLPMNKVKKFIRMFNDTINIEDGIFVYELENAPITVMLNDTHEIVAIGDIFATEDEMIFLH